MTIEQLTAALLGKRISHWHACSAEICSIRKIETVTELTEEQVHVSGPNSHGGHSGIYLPIAIAELLIKEGMIKSCDAFAREIEVWNLY